MKNWMIRTAVVAAVAALFGCTSQDSPQAPPPSSSTSVTTSTTTPSAIPFHTFAYEANPEREAKISAVTREFGLVVLQEAKKRGSTWGVFDTYCATKDQSRDGWTSKGYTPNTGDQCSTQHNPQYGKPALQISATFVVLGNNQYDFVGANVNTSNCRVGTNHFLYDGVRRATTDFDDQSTSTATSAMEASEIDAKVVDCIKNTRP